MRQLPSGEWWSDVSPWVQRLSRRNILATADASLSWDKLSLSSTSPSYTLPFAVHLWIAGSEGTVCKWEGVDGIMDMKRRLPGYHIRADISDLPNIFQEVRILIISSLSLPQK